MNEIKNKISDFFTQLSAREKYLILISFVVISFMSVYKTSVLISSSFVKQNETISDLKTSYTTLGIILDRYKTLSTRLKTVESSLKKNGPPGGVRSYLEKALINTTNLSAGQYSIKPGAKRQLGKNYDQSPFTVRFTTTEIKSIVKLLKELTEGKSALLLTRLDITKSRRADKLTVVIDISSITNAS